MLKKTLTIAVTGCALLTATAISSAQTGHTDCTNDAMLVFDGSGSMAGIGHNGLTQPRIEEAREAIAKSIPRIAPFRKLGLVIFGPGQKDSCSNIDLRFTPIVDAAPHIIADVNNLAPIGETPLTDSVKSAVAALDLSENPGVVLLLTDGRESCGGDPCALADQLAAANNVTVHVIGFKVRARGFQWNGQGKKNRISKARCLADRTGGTYASTESTDELVKALQEMLACPLFSSRRSPGLRL